MAAGIYCITNLVNQKKYIGQTYDFDSRWWKHKNFLKNGKHENRHLQFAWNKYGASNFEFSVVEIISGDNQAFFDEREIYWINFYDSLNNGYNLTQGGGGCRGYKHTPEEIEKMRKAAAPHAVLQYDMDLNFIKRWESASQAAKTLSLSPGGIRAVCKRERKQKTLGGSIWVYEYEVEQGLVDWEYYLNSNRSYPKAVKQFNLWGEFVKEWESLYSACKLLNIGRRVLYRAVKSNSQNYVYTAGQSYWVLVGSQKNIKITYYAQYDPESLQIINKFFTQKEAFAATGIPECKIVRLCRDKDYSAAHRELGLWKKIEEIVVLK